MQDKRHALRYKEQELILFSACHGLQHLRTIHNKYLHPAAPGAPAMELSMMAASSTLGASGPMTSRDEA